MIDISLKFIRDEINKYLDPLNSGTNNVDLQNITKVIDHPSDTESKIFLSLINVEEDRISRNPENFRKIDNKVVYKNPKIHLNLYCLFTPTHSEYETALKQLSSVIQFFQFTNVFTHENTPTLDSGIDKLIFDLYSLNFEQLNHLWGMIGGKYMPSVLYKMRMIMLEESAIEAEGGLIKEVGIQGSDFTH